MGMVEAEEDTLLNNPMDASRILYPAKSIWAVFWFAILGVSAFLGNIYYLGNQWQPRKPVSTTPAVLAAANAPLMETDAEYLFKSEQITEPHQKIEFANPADIADFALALRDLAYGRRHDPVRILH
jgi:hypothetical protein